MNTKNKQEDYFMVSATNSSWDPELFGYCFRASFKKAQDQLHSLVQVNQCNG